VQSEPSEHLERRRIELAPKTLVFVPLTVAACWVLLKLLPVVLVCVVGLFLVGTLNPAVAFLERKHVNRSTAVVLVFVGLFISTAGLLVLTLAPLIDQVGDLIKHEPELRGKLADLLAHSRFTAQLGQSLKHVQYGQLAKASAPQVWVASTRAAELVAYLFSAIFVALYVMIDRDRLRGGLFALVPRRFHIRMSRVLLNLETIVGGYIRGQALTCGLMAAFTFVLLWICGVPNALAVSMFAGLADVLPYIGVVLAIGPAAAVAATQGLPTLLIVVGVMLAYEEFESRFLVPRIYGKALRLPSSMVLIALLAGGTLMGIMGALLALPVAAAIRMLILELRVSLPGERVDDEIWRARDEKAEREYQDRAQDAPAEQAAAIAVEISEQRLKKEGDQALEAPMTSGQSRS
jgi:putative heme transporter